MNMLEAITADCRPSERFFSLMDAVMTGSETEACLAVSNNRLWLRRLACKRHRRLRRRASALPEGEERDNVIEDARATNTVIRALARHRLKKAPGLLVEPVHCRV